MKSIVLYHVTTANNRERIQRSKGLGPQVGPRSQKLNEDKLIFFFKDELDAGDGVMNWLGDEFDDDKRLALLKIKLPKDYPSLDTSNIVEATSEIPVSLKHIKCINHDY